MSKFNFYDSSQVLEEKFHFLIDKYDFICSKKEQTNMGFELEFTKDEIRVLLYYDYRDNFFYFFLIKGRETTYPNDVDTENIIPFYKLAPSGFDTQNLQPNELQFEEAINANVKLLNDYAVDILKEGKWIV